MSMFHNNILAGDGGTPGGGPTEPTLYVDEVFATFLYGGSGTSQSQSIDNGIDLSTHGGMVWLKNRDRGYGNSGDYDHFIGDTARGPGKVLITNDDDREQNTDPNDTFKSFDSSGFTVGGDSAYNGYNNEFLCSWTFRKCPGFFDIVTYTGDGNNGRTVSHGLGSVPGSIWIKRLDAAGDWTVYHRGMHNTRPQDYAIFLNTSGERQNEPLFADTAPTGSVFSVGSDDKVNKDGKTYVAYLFAHDHQAFGENGNEPIIKCGKYTGNGGAQLIDLGFEPQWMIVKRTNGNNVDDDWYIMDCMRGWYAFEPMQTNRLVANKDDIEGSDPHIFIHPKGLRYGDGANADSHNKNGNNYIYIAIRRSHKPPTLATEVFAQKLTGGSNLERVVTISGAGLTDMTIIKNTIDLHTWITGSRPLGSTSYELNTTAAGSTEIFGPNINVWGQMTGTRIIRNVATSSMGYAYMYYQFTRKHGVFDVAVYQGTAGSQDITHNLGVTPEMIWVKKQSKASNYATMVYSGTFGNLTLGDDSSRGSTGSNAIVHNHVNASTFRLPSTNSNTNENGEDYVAYLFASKPGISKIGTYDGSSGDVDVDCGFTNGARFIIVKRLDQDGDWYVFGTEIRGIVPGKDSYMILNTNATAVINQDYIDPYNAGFRITSSAPDGLNYADGSSHGTYLFYALA